MTAAIVAAVVVLWVAAWPSRSVPATGFLDPRPSAAHHRRGLPRPQHVVRRLGHAVRDRCRCRTSGSSVRRVHGSRRRHSTTRASELCERSPVHRCGGDQHQHRALHSAGTRYSAVSPRGRGIGGSRRRSPSGRLRHRRAPGFPEAGAGLARLDRRRRRRRVAERRQRMAERVVAEPGPDAARLPCETRRGARLDARSGERHY